MMDMDTDTDTDMDTANGVDTGIDMDKDNFPVTPTSMCYRVSCTLQMVLPICSSI
jgi:hypothetical protein